MFFVRIKETSSNNKNCFIMLIRPNALKAYTTKRKHKLCYFNHAIKLFCHINKTVYLHAARQLRSFTLNFGPQHPAAHGVVKLTMQVVGEIIQRVDPQFGLLHRGSEKLMETRNFLQSLPYFDRFDYVANLFQEHAYCLAVESVVAQPKTLETFTLAVRTLFDEFSRVANHLLTTAAINMDMGAMGPMFWAFEEREQLMEFFERVSGARMHTAMYAPFFCDSTAVNKILLQDIARFLTRASRALSGAFLGLLNNRALKTRFSFVGQLSINKLQAYGISGLIARSAGANSDLRFEKNHAYGVYQTLTFRSFIGKRGDNWDRFLLRVKETVESMRIVSQTLNVLFTGVGHRQRLAKGPFSGMEETIAHFKNFSEGFKSEQAIVYREVESPKGNVGVLLVTDGSTKPNRIKLRTPVAHNMNLIPSVAVGVLFADFVATFSSFDIVLGEIDR